MTHTLSEQDYIEKFGEQEYLNLCAAAYTTMRECEEFKNDQPYCHCLAVYTRTDLRGDKKTVIVESSAHKILRAPIGEGHIMSAVDFGIVTMHISDEEMPDLALDRYNEYKREKEKLKNKNKKTMEKIKIIDLTRDLNGIIDLWVIFDIPFSRFEYIASEADKITNKAKYGFVSPTGMMKELFDLAENPQEVAFLGYVAGSANTQISVINFLDDMHNSKQTQ